MKIQELKSKSIENLLTLAKSLNIKNIRSVNKKEIIFAILKKKSATETPVTGGGTLEILQEGFGFLRSAKFNYLPSGDDIYMSVRHIRKMALRTGDTIEGELHFPLEGERYFALKKITYLNLEAIKNINFRRSFELLTPLHPNTKLMLETDDITNKIIIDEKKVSDFTTRIIDIIAPIGKGQRALITAPPRTGKTVILQNIARVIEQNHPNIFLIMLLIDERPEEVTDNKRSIKGEVISSTFDEPASRHVQVAEMVLEKSKRLVEQNKDVVILLDSITRLARAYNTVVPSSGKVLTGGIDANALQKPKRFFGAARNIENGGSLTIIGTALVETGSRMDEVIFEEFKGTGNSEIILDRKLANKRIYPSIDVIRSGTRKEELMVDQNTLRRMWILRRVLDPMGKAESMNFLLARLRKSKSNVDFFKSMNS